MAKNPCIHIGICKPSCLVCSFDSTSLLTPNPELQGDRVFALGKIGRGVTVNLIGIRFSSLHLLYFKFNTFSIGMEGEGLLNMDLVFCSLTHSHVSYRNAKTSNNITSNWHSQTC